MCTGLICLILKGGDKSVPKNWMPITLLGTAYKILVKTLALCLRPLLPDILRVAQNDFAQDWSILDNVFSFWEATHWAQESQQDIVVLLLDFEKAYDIIN